MKAEAVLTVAVFAATGLAAWLIYRKAASLGGAVQDAAVRLWNGPATAAADYSAAVNGALTNPGIFTGNTYAYDLKDLTPPGFRINQYGGFEPINNGVTGTW